MCSWPMSSRRTRHRIDIAIICVDLAIICASSMTLKESWSKRHSATCSSHQLLSSLQGSWTHLTYNNTDSSWTTRGNTRMKSQKYYMNRISQIYKDALNVHLYSFFMFWRASSWINSNHIKCFLNLILVIYDSSNAMVSCHSVSQQVLPCMCIPLSLSSFGDLATVAVHVVWVVLVLFKKK